MWCEIYIINLSICRLRPWNFVVDRFSGSHDQPSQPCGRSEEGVACLHEVYHYALCTEIMLCMYLPISLRTVHRDNAVHVFANITTHCAQRLCCACICQYHYALCTEIMLCMYLPISLRTVHRDYAVHVFATSALRAQTGASLCLLPVLWMAMGDKMWQLNVTMTDFFFNCAPVTFQPWFISLASIES